VKQLHYENPPDTKSSKYETAPQKALNKQELGDSQWFLLCHFTSMCCTSLRKFRTDSEYINDPFLCYS